MDLTKKNTVQDLSTFSCYWKASTPLYLVTKESSAIDIYCGPDIMSGCPNTKNEIISTTTFSLCGNHILLGCDSGKLLFYSYKKSFKEDKFKECNLFDRKISFLKCIESGADETDNLNSNDWCGVVVAGSDNKVALVRKDCPVVHFELPHEIHDVFFISNHFIFVTKGGDIFIKSLFNEHEILKECRVEVKTVVFHKQRSVLAGICMNGSSYVLIGFKITFISEKIEIKTCFQLDLKLVPNCLSFSHDGQWLAVGYQNGGIGVSGFCN